MSVSFFAAQLPPVLFICCIISFLWLLNFLHFNIKWSTVCSSSHGHIGLSLSPNLCKYELIFPYPVSIVVNSGNIGIFCSSLFLTDRKKSFVTAPFPYPSTAVPTYETFLGMPGSWIPSLALTMIVQLHSKLLVTLRDTQQTASAAQDSYRYICQPTHCSRDKHLARSLINKKKHKETIFLRCLVCLLWNQSANNYYELQKGEDSEW